MLYAMPELSAADLRVLDELKTMRAELGMHLRSKPRWEGQLRRSLFAAAIQGSNTIENITISNSDARALVEHAPLSAAASDETQQAVVGYRDAMTYVQQAPLMDFFEYSETALSAIHFMITRYQPAKWPGRYRPGGIFVSSSDPLEPMYTGPDADRVPGLMGELVDWLRDGDRDAPAYARAAMAHLNLVAIHPWRDGNGRTARALHTLVLARTGEPAPEFSSIEEWLGEQINTLQYYQALRVTQGGSFQPERDARPWLTFALTAHHRQAQRVQRRYEWTVRLWTDLARLAEDRGLAERTVSALYAAAIGELRRTTYQRDEDLSRDRAIRDVQALTRAGLLTPHGHATGRVYVLGGVAAEIAEAAAAAVRGPGRDPYA
ncbi:MULTISPECIES: Fic family protein [Actinoplanes]|uniref:Fic family protein n=1 Tax=Actinoplanes TaxID=1865 RepID=UPI0005F299B2|nr:MULTISPECIES: Fic family protein [Actinoplanes]GLY04002.1 cell division protein Fic [Actinoplanes sp. NBRC 101535]